MKEKYFPSSGFMTQLFHPGFVIKCPALSFWNQDPAIHQPDKYNSGYKKPDLVFRVFKVKIYQQCECKRTHDYRKQIHFHKKRQADQTCQEQNIKADRSF